jgi:hypothetical protein
LQQGSEYFPLRYTDPAHFPGYAGKGYITLAVMNIAPNSACDFVAAAVLNGDKGT